MAGKLKKFVPPTLEQVEQYVKEKGLQVDPQFFCEYYEADNWHSKGEPVKSWKQKILTWHRKEMLKGKPKKCYCGKPGCYFAGHDDAGFPYFYCVEHKPKFKPLPAGHPANTIKFKPIPQADKRSVSDKVNEQKNKLKIK